MAQFLTKASTRNLRGGGEEVVDGSSVFGVSMKRVLALRNAKAFTEKLKENLRRQNEVCL